MKQKELKMEHAIIINKMFSNFFKKLNLKSSICVRVFLYITMDQKGIIDLKDRHDVKGG